MESKFIMTAEIKKKPSDLSRHSQTRDVLLSNEEVGFISCSVQVSGGQGTILSTLWEYYGE